LFFYRKHSFDSVFQHSIIHNSIYIYSNSCIGSHLWMKATCLSWSGGTIPSMSFSIALILHIMVTYPWQPKINFHSLAVIDRFYFTIQKTIFCIIPWYKFMVYSYKWIIQMYFCIFHLHEHSKNLFEMIVFV
jgi:hypothetical protein